MHDRVEEPQEVPVGSVAASVGTGGSRWIAEEVPLAEDDAAFVLEREMQKVFAALAELNVEPESVAHVPAADPSFSASADPFPAAYPEPVISQTEPDSVAAVGESHEEAFAASSEQPLQVAAEAENNAGVRKRRTRASVEAAVSREPYASQETPSEVSESAAAAEVEVEVVAVAEPVMETQGTEAQGTETQDTETQGVEVLGKTGESEPEHEAAEPVTMAVASQPVAEPATGGCLRGRCGCIRELPRSGPSARWKQYPSRFPRPWTVAAPLQQRFLQTGRRSAKPNWRPHGRSGDKSVIRLAARRQHLRPRRPPWPRSPPQDSRTFNGRTPAQPASHTTSSEPADPASIASIVDSMLAELRPKLVEEIARKMGQEKK